MGIAYVIALVWGCLLIPRVIVSWSIAYRLYGRLPFSLARHMLYYARRSNKKIAIDLTAYAIVFTGMVLILHFFQFGYSPLWLVVASISYTIYLLCGTMLVALPPSILYLSASSDESTLLFASLAEQLKKYRAVTLIRPTSGLKLSFGGQQVVKMDVIRALDDSEWRKTVFHLMDVVPLIVIEMQERTSFVDEEISRLKEKGYEERSILLERLPPIDQFLAMIEPKLRNPIDIAGRAKRQAEYASTFWSTHESTPDEEGNADKVWQAKALQSKAISHFLKKYKKRPLPPRDSQIYEDIPSKITRDAELQYLQSNPKLKQAEILLRTAFEDEKSSFGPFRDLNMAIACTSLGGVERLRCNWDNAIKWLSQGIERLNALERQPNSDEYGIKGELATAHFLFGETHMGRYRDQRDERDRQDALNHFRKSMAYDFQIGANVTVTKKRINALNLV